MIAYRQQQERMESAACIRGMAETLRRLRRRGSAGHEDAVRLLIDFGEFETAVADALSTEANRIDPIVARLRRTSLLAGHLFYWSWQSSPADVGLWASRLERALGEIAALPLPKQLEIRLSEGYAYYSLAPETFLAAAGKFRRDRGRVNAVCIGIRSIGASLSSVVAAALEEQGCAVDPYTVRCGGHPFDRRLLLDPATAGKIRTQNNRYYLIVDEGPGLSGSTLGCVADKLSELGVPDERIVFFPGRDADAATLLSESARNRWPRHRKYLADFDEVWVQSGRLTQLLPEGRLVDISAGKWRSLLCGDESRWPAVHPWHERRKYLHAAADSDLPVGGASPPGLHGGATPLLLKFAGFGRYGESTCARATLLARAGLHPPMLGLNNGFLMMEFVPGTPLCAGDIDKPFLDHVVRYLARLHRIPPTIEPMPSGELMQMIEVNIAEGLGRKWLDRLSGARLPVPRGGHPTGLTDGRMLLHEWLRTPNGYLKTDGVDHYSDHFSPSCGDAGWDIAACIAEWALHPSMQNHLISQYAFAAADDELPKRLPFYRVAYLAHRLGYATMAAQTLGAASADGRRFETLARGYREMLEQELLRL